MTMDLIQLKGYLRARRIVPLQDMALHFQTDIETVLPLLAVWIGKSKGRQRPGQWHPVRGAADATRPPLKSTNGLNEFFHCSGPANPLENGKILLRIYY